MPPAKHFEDHVGVHVPAGLHDRDTLSGCRGAFCEETGDRQGAGGFSEVVRGGEQHPHRLGGGVLGHGEDAGRALDR